MWTSRGESERQLSQVVLGCVCPHLLPQSFNRIAMPAFVIFNKRDIISLVSLLVGIGVGWFVASRPNARLTRHTRDLEMTIDSIGNVQETYSGGMASLAVNAIQCIDSGKTQ